MDLPVALGIFSRIEKKKRVQSTGKLFEFLETHKLQVPFHPVIADYI